ncbi:MAG: 2-dehydropantoate 2-reductase [Deltaproteobacteria bacterium]|nr:2-dehydropantoate 2-reductase [Deltaproteobacteria bacterium]
MTTGNLHYAVLGMGPVGSTLATLLKQSGQRVSVLCGERPQFNAVMDHPVVVSGSLNAEARFTDVFLDLRDVIAAKPDVLFIVTKACDSPVLLRDLKRFGIHGKAIFVSCQNGLDVENQIVEIFGTARALRMVLNLGVGFLKQNEVRVHFNYSHVLSLRGEVNADVTRVIAEDLNRAGLTIEPRADYRSDVFKKVILNSAVGTVCALTGMTMKEVYQEREIGRLVRQLIREGIAVGQAMKLNIADSFFEEAVQYLAHAGDHKPSMLVDIEHARHTENEYQCGKIFEYAEKLGLEVAATQTLYYLLKSLEKNTIQKSGRKI